MNKIKTLKTTQILALICALVVAFLFVGNGIQAYLSTTKSVTNTFTVGVEESRIVENFTPLTSLAPNQTFTKEVRVENTGTIGTYIRIFCEASDSAVGDLLQYNFNTTDWTTKQADGYYYYKTVLQPGELTQPLFTRVTYTGTTTLTGDYSIIVYEESAQAEGSANYTEAFASIS